MGGQTPGGWEAMASSGKVKMGGQTLGAGGMMPSRQLRMDEQTSDGPFA
jgi:hypothetical protein